MVAGEGARKGGGGGGGNSHMGCSCNVYAIGWSDGNAAKLIALKGGEKREAKGGRGSKRRETNRLGDDLRCQSSGSMPK